MVDNLSLEELQQSLEEFLAEGVNAQLYYGSHQQLYEAWNDWVHRDDPAWKLRQAVVKARAKALLTEYGTKLLRKDGV